MGYTVKEFKDILAGAFKRNQPPEGFTTEEVVAAGSEVGIPSETIVKEIEEREAKALKSLRRREFIFRAIGISLVAAFALALMVTTIISGVERSQMQSRRQDLSVLRVRLEESIRYQREILSSNPTAASREGSANRVHIACSRYESKRASLAEVSNEPIPTCSDIINRSNHQ